MSLTSSEQLQNRKWILKSEVQKSKASENKLNKILQYGRIGHNVEGDQHKVADVTNNQKWVSLNTAMK